MTKKYLSKKEVSAMTGLSVGLLNRWISEKVCLPFIRAGKGRILYDTKDVTEFMERNKQAVS